MIGKINLPVNPLWDWPPLFLIYSKNILSIGKRSKLQSLNSFLGAWKKLNAIKENLIRSLIRPWHSHSEKVKQKMNEGMNEWMNEWKTHNCHISISVHEKSQILSFCHDAPIFGPTASPVVHSTWKINRLCCFT